MRQVNLAQLNLNRAGSQLSLSELPEGAHVGFRWREDDWKTTRWYPQGMTGAQAGDLESEWLFVAWYSKHSPKRGVRVSAIKVDPYSSRWLYRHILLVDQGGGFLRGGGASVHAGGLAFRGRALYLTDTLKRGDYKIRVFPLENLLKVPKRRLEHHFDYRYVLRESSSYPVGIKPTFLSYQEERGLFTMGSFYKERRGQLRRFSMGELSAGALQGEPATCLNRMQGACVARGHLFISQSYGRSNQSALCWRSLDHPRPESGLSPEQMKRRELPPGTQDLFYHRVSDTLWTHSEFPHTLAYGYQDRSLFGFRVSELI